jgi:hypothetical protein
VANEVKDVTGEAQALITVYKRCKMMLLPIRSQEVLVGFVLRLTTNIEDCYKLVDQVEFSLADTTRHHWLKCYFHLKRARGDSHGSIWYHPSICFQTCINFLPIKQH